MQKILTRNSEETKNLAKVLAMEIRGGEVICLSGDLGSGKTTFTQGLLEALGAEGPYTSPTFTIIKKYDFLKANAVNPPAGRLKTIYHIDAYRVEEKDLLELGWQDFAGKENCITIVEWAKRIEKIIPSPPAGGALWLNFKWLSENEREIIIYKNIKTRKH